MNSCVKERGGSGTRAESDSARWVQPRAMIYRKKTGHLLVASEGMARLAELGSEGLVGAKGLQRDVRGRHHRAADGGVEHAQVPALEHQARAATATMAVHQHLSALGPPCIDGVDGVDQRFAQRGVGVLTVFAFSSENWKRPKAELDFLMALLTQIRLVRKLRGRMDDSELDGELGRDADILGDAAVRIVDVVGQQHAQRAWGDRDLGALALRRGGERIGVRHLEHAGDAAHHRRARPALEVFLVGEAGLAEIFAAR